MIGQEARSGDGATGPVRPLRMNYEIQYVSGELAREWDIRQAAAVAELVRWVNHKRNHGEHPDEGCAHCREEAGERDEPAAT